jgi:transposase
MKKGAPAIFPLNPAKYHLKLLAKGRIVDFQLVGQGGRNYAHICLKHEMQTRPVRSVIGIDLGVRRALATVLLKPTKRIRREDLSIIRDQEVSKRIDLLNCRIALLQQRRRWGPLKRIRKKRRNLARHYDHLMAIKVAKKAEQEGSMVVVGYPMGIKYESYRGNGKPKLTKILQQRFPYQRRVQLILGKCHQLGIPPEAVQEAWTSKRCHRCGSLNTRRPSQALFWCLDCGLQYNADWNSAINIGSVFSAKRLSRKATEGLAHSKDELAHQPTSLEVGNDTSSTEFPTASYASFRFTGEK